jgi:hypothetical protein
VPTAEVDGSESLLLECPSHRWSRISARSREVGQDRTAKPSEAGFRYLGGVIYGGRARARVKRGGASREDVIRSLIAGLFMLLCAPAFAQQQTPPIINFESVPNPLRLPDNMYFGEVSGIALNSKGHVFVLSRGNTTGPAYAAAATQLLEFDADGNFLREIGHNLYAWSFAHMLKIDPHDNIWVTDKGSDTGACRYASRLNAWPTRAAVAAARPRSHRNEALP